MTNTITDTLNAAYNGEINTTLAEALAVVAAHFYDPVQSVDMEGYATERNNFSWSQRMALQSVANMAYRQLYDTGLDSQKRVRGVAHKLDKARSYAKQTLRTATGGTEFDIQQVDRALDWVERLESEVAALDEMFHTAAAMYEAAVGEAFKPYAPWTAKSNGPRATNSDIADIRDRAARVLGEAFTPDVELQTDGVDTQEANVA